MADKPVALVTGAGRGIGAAIARELAHRGYRLVAADRTVTDVAETVRAICAAGQTAVAAGGDLADPDVPKQLVDSALASLGRIDLLVNNAAWRELSPTRTMSCESWERTLAVGLTAPVLLARAVAPIMRRQASGVIINISSVQSQLVDGFIAAYAASKGGLEAATRDLAAELGPWGIRVLAVAPGAIGAGTSQEAAADRAVREFTEDMIMLRRWGRPEEVGRVVAALASDDFSYVTAATIVVDGGLTHQHLPHSLKRQWFPEDFT